MREHSVNSLNNFIGGWYMEDTQLLDDIVSFFDDPKSYQNKYVGCVGVGEDLIEDASLKDDTELWINHNPELKDRYYSALQSVLDQYMIKYPYSNFYGSFGINHPTKIQKYSPNGGYHIWHTERSNAHPSTVTRHLVFMTYLNDVVGEGGETRFFHQNLKVKPEKGLTLIWPADWTFTHKGIASPTQDKYIITGWFNYLD
jgi:hypothetical protein